MFDPSPEEFSQLVADDVRTHADVEQAAWLRERHQWLDWRAELELLRKTVQSHIAIDQLSLEEIKPIGTEQPSEQYMIAKREYAGRHRGRLRFLRSVEERVAEVSKLIRNAGVIDSAVLMGVLVKALVLLERGNTDSALEVLEGAIDSTVKKLTEVAA